MRAVVFDLDGTLLDPRGAVRATAAGWCPFDDVQSTLANLDEAGLRLAVLTDGAAEQQHAKVAALGIRDRFEVVLTSEEIGVAKPDPAAYRAVCLALELAPDEVLHVGARHDLDVVAARSAGLQALHLDRGGTGQEASGGRLPDLAGLPHWLAVVERRSQAQEQRSALLSAIEETRAARRLTFSDDEHDPDGSLASLDQARDVALLRQTEETLERLAAAQHRLSAGTYALCEVCGGQIAPDRLLARPETRRCVSCARPAGRRRG